MPTLGEIVHIKAGYSFRSRIERVPDGTIAVIQASDVPDSGFVAVDDLAHIEPAEGLGAEFVEPGDIVITTRGDSIRAAVVPATPRPAIIAAPLLRCRVANGHVMPEYLAWYLNQPKVEATLTRSAEGTNIKMIRRAVLEALEIDVPPFERQHIVVQLADLAEREHSLQSELEIRTGQLLSAVMMQFAEGGAR
ncbi:MAG: restriction endonuclease subunit S [Actinomycetota bacterium]|nr:restriction endonuclease subunit S [Actinomycetota bacterium]